MLACIAYPLAQSFERRITYWKKWKYVFPAILITSGFFIIWDEFFTRIGIWSFNKQYTLGLDIGSLPIEEWLFFFIVPYCSFFVYFVANYFIKKDPLKNVARLMALFFVVALLLIGTINLDKWYTASSFLLTAVLLAYLTFIVKAEYLGRFFMAYFIGLIPLLIVNGVLTSRPVVLYNDLENLGIRIFIPEVSNIPIEDTIYFMLLLLMNVSLYETFSSRNKRDIPNR
jgi:lycopene cyclase domain-containing protein